MSWGTFDSSTFGKALYLLDRAGVFEYLLPFMIYFLIIYGLLMKSKIFTSSGSDGGSSSVGNRINLLLSLSMSLIILYYVPASRTIGMFLSEILTKWGALAIMLLLIPLTLAIFGISFQTKTPQDNAKLVWGGAAVVGALLLFISYGTLSSMFREFRIYIDPTFLATSLIILMIGAVIWYVGNPKEGSSQTGSG